MTRLLKRTTFTTSRLLEFFTPKELAMQIGTSKEAWPVALVKELVDNALDACETADVAPEIEVEVEDDRVSVRDNGPGLPVEVLYKSLDYATRTSDKTHYVSVSPTRGQLGNALKCVWAAGYVVNDEARVDVHTGGLEYRVEVSLDKIAQEPKIDVLTYPDGIVKSGTLLTVHWRG